LFSATASFFESFPIAFQEVHGFNLGEGGLAFMGIFVAVLLSYGVFCWYFIAYFRPLLIKTKGNVAPEMWLQPALVGGICLPISLFFFGWTVSPHIHWIVPILGSMVFAPGIFGLFAAGLNYLAFCYGDNVASVFAANDFTRAAIGAAMPLVSRQMFRNLDRGPTDFPVAWGCTLLGCIATLMAVIPFALMHFGARLRGLSKYATSHPEHGSVRDGEKM
jgi:DHA1 family multidrug resistance protein-like MFS transporter